MRTAGQAERVDLSPDACETPVGDTPSIGPYAMLSLRAIPGHANEARKRRCRP